MKNKEENVGSNDKNSELYFPYKWDDTGRCEMLTDDNKCSVYEDRPLICNIDEVLSIIGTTKEEFYAINIAACNKMMDEDKLPLKYRIREMSTRANIRFEDEYGAMHVDRSHDGFPDNILTDIKETIDLCKGRWSGTELGQLVSAFIGMHFDNNKRIQNYEPCIDYETAGDESYCYWVKWNKEKQEYEYGVVE